MTYFLINCFILLFFPFIFRGIIIRTKAIWAGRRGAPLLQPLYDCIRLLKKERVISTITSEVFRIAPVIILSSALFASCFVPLLFKKSLLSFTGDFIVFAYILALGRFFMIISAMDTGSSFEGMGASRESFFSALTEPAFFITVASISAVCGKTSLSDSVLAVQFSLESPLLIILTALVLFMLTLVEGCRVPVDDPNTHLELTMIHEVMILDNSGPDLAFITYAASLKMLLFSSLTANLFIPPETSIGAAAAIWLIAVCLHAILTGCVESLMARFRLSHVPQFIFFSISMAFIILATTHLTRFGGLQ